MRIRLGPMKSKLVDSNDDFLREMESLYLGKGHPNEAGYELLSARILEALERRTGALIQAPSLQLRCQ